MSEQPGIPGFRPTQANFLAPGKYENFATKNKNKYSQEFADFHRI